MTGAHERHTPRTCTVDNANRASSGDNVPNYIANLAIDPVTKQVDFSNSVPILSQTEVTPQLRENMQQQLDMILEFFQGELTKLENGELKEEELLLSPYDIQTDDTDTQRPVRSLPEAFNVNSGERDPLIPAKLTPQKGGILLTSKRTI